MIYSWCFLLLVRLMVMNVLRSFMSTTSTYTKYFCLRLFVWMFWPHNVMYTIYLWVSLGKMSPGQRVCVSVFYGSPHTYHLHLKEPCENLHEMSLKCIFNVLNNLVSSHIVCWCCFFSFYRFGVFQVTPNNIQHFSLL